MSETKEGMQQSLNIFQLYCDLWKLDVNINKTKVMVFSKKRNLNYSFILQDKQLEVVEKFSYLGIIFKYNGTFFDTKKKLVDQAQIKGPYILFIRLSGTKAYLSTYN